MDYFKIEHNNVAPAQGKILISEPFVQDAYFKRAVVLLTSEENGFFIGFALNKFTDFNINETIKDFPVFNTKISIGGPVRLDTLHFIHILGDQIPGSVKIMNNLWWGGNFEILKQHILEGNVKNNHVRFFIGYSGWEPKQLEREISENSWLVTDLDSETIMKCEESIWKKTLKNLGNKYKLWTTFPENPAMN